MLALLWAAAAYRIVLSIRAVKTVWRTAFTVCIVSVALGATLDTYGHRTLDPWLMIWNLSALLTHLSLIVAAASTSIYVSTLRRVKVSTCALIVRVAVAASAWAMQIGAWLHAPVHGRELPDFAVAWSNGSVCVFNTVFVLVIVLAAAETAVFCLTQAASRDDLTRTISLSLTGTACLAAAVAFSLGGVVVFIRYLTGSDPVMLAAIFDTSIPFIMVVLALGTLSLLVGPPMIDLVRHFSQWQTLRPLWRDLIDAAPQVHLNVTVTGGPRQRLHLRVQRATVEIHDALRLTRVPVNVGANLEELARALHAPGRGHCTAAELLDHTETSEADVAQLLTLARKYSRSAA